MPRRLAAFDELDRRLIGCLSEGPPYGLQEASRRLRVARGTVQSRLDRLRARGVITGIGPRIDPKAVGFTVQSFTVLEAEQASRQELIAGLAAIPNVLEAHIVAGQGDILCRLAAQDNNDLRAVIDTILAVPGVRRATTLMALTEIVPYRVEPLFAIAARAPHP